MTQLPNTGKIALQDLQGCRDLSNDVAPGCMAGCPRQTWDGDDGCRELNTVVNHASVKHPKPTAAAAAAAAAAARDQNLVEFCHNSSQDQRAFYAWQPVK